MNIYVAGVGVGMGPLAFIARDVGHNVVCSDLVQHDLVDYMRESGFTVHIGQDGVSIAEEHEKSPIDWFVYTAALPEDHPELTFARENDIKTSKRDGFLNEVLEQQDLRMIAIAGTHGKTNTTAMTIWCLQQAGIPLSYSVGTRIPFGEYGKYEEHSRYFVYEADEFDRNFLQFKPAISLVLNIEYDHPDTYPSQTDYDMAFAQFIEQSDRTYLYNDSFEGEHERVTKLEKNQAEDSTSIPGVYIRQNARLLQEMLLREFDVPMTDSADYIAAYPGSSRRMEQLRPNLYSDYAHHPDEIKATVELGLELSDDVVVIYQPHQNVRQHEIIDTYTNCFEGARKVYWLPTYLSRENQSLDILTPEQLTEGLSNRNSVEICDMDDALVESIQNELDAGAIVIGMAAGDFDHWLRENFSD